MMKKILLLFLFLLPALSLTAQEVADSLNMFQRIDARMYRSQHKARVDTAYIDIPEERWTFKTSSNYSWNTLGIRHQVQEEGYATVLNSTPTLSQGFSVAWRWLELGVSVNPGWFIPSLKNSDQAYSISFFGNKFSMSATFRVSNSYRGSIISYPDSTVTEIPLGAVNADISGDFDAYYVFNGDKFSFPAAFSMMQTQKRSAGSPVLSLSLRNGVTRFAGLSYQGTEEMSLITNILAVGAGYAHNFVTPHHWLLHVSAMANLSLLSYNKFYTSAGDYRMQKTFPDWVGVFQAAALHWTGRWFYGVNLSVRGATYGAQDRLEFSNARTEGHVILGLRL